MLFSVAQLRTVDLLGVQRGMMIPLSSSYDSLQDVTKDPNLLNGASIDGSSLGFSAVEHSDLKLFPDINAGYVLMNRGMKIPMFFSQILSDGKPFPGDVREHLKKTINKWLGTEYQVFVKPEPEFFLTTTDKKPLDTAPYASFYPRAKAMDFLVKLMQEIPHLGMKSVVAHHEVGPGQYEVELLFNDALTSADHLILFKDLVMARALEEGYNATFMPKPFVGQAGNGLHFHIYIMKNGENIFKPTEKDELLSEFGRYFIGGIMKHAQALTAILNPSVNSYKRLVPGFEAPVYNSWGPKNRTTMIRIPEAKDPEKTRFEIRNPDASTNPYLALSAIIVAGMLGVKEKIEPPNPRYDNVFDLTPEQLDNENISLLPSSLGEALNILKHDQDFFKQALGDVIGKHFLALKQKEWQEYQTQVTDWEKNRYWDL